jgi:hypothetical protein
MLEPARLHARELARPGFYAEFASDTDAVLAARELVRRAHPVLDAFTPRPVAALEELVAPGRSTLNRTVFVCGLVGALTGLGIEWFCNGFDYPLNVGGRPPFALPAYIPITFEAMVLFASFGAFFGFLRRAGLPWLSHPVFEVPGFERASIDRFFLLVERPAASAGDELRALLVELGALDVYPTPGASPCRGRGEPAPAAATRETAPSAEPAA